MVTIEILNVAGVSLSVAALGLAGILASSDWRFKTALNRARVRSAAARQRMERLRARQQLTEIADQAKAARRDAERITPGGFGRSQSKA